MPKAEREKLLVVDNDDGIFFMSLADTWTSGQSLTITHDALVMQRDHFLMINDKTTDKGLKKNDAYCGTSCTAHTVKVKSDEAQTVFVSVHTWEN